LLQELQAGAITEARLIRLEEGLKGIEKRLDDTNKRIDDLRSEMGSLRSDMSQLRTEVNGRIDGLGEDMRFWLGLIVTVMLAGFGGLFGFGMYLFKNIRQPQNMVEGKTVVEAREGELENLRNRLVALEAQIKQMQSGPA
jgi:cell division protein FtsB